jgi:hypothetical protein
MSDRYIWHETINTQHTRRSYLSEIAPHVLATIQSWLANDQFAMPGDYQCRIVARSADCLRAIVLTADGVALVRIAIAAHNRCGLPAWRWLGGVEGAEPETPWCAATTLPEGAIADPEAYKWLGDFERCLAWSWLTRENPL